MKPFKSYRSCRAIFPYSQWTIEKQNWELGIINVATQDRFSARFGYKEGRWRGVSRLHKNDVRRRKHVATPPLPVHSRRHHYSRPTSSDSRQSGCCIRRGRLCLDWFPSTFVFFSSRFVRVFFFVFLGIHFPSRFIIVLVPLCLDISTGFKAADDCKFLSAMCICRDSLAFISQFSPFSLSLSIPLIIILLLLL